MKKSIIMFFLGLGTVFLIILVYFLINYFTSKPINYFTFFTFPLTSYLSGAVTSKLNSKILPKTMAEITKFLALVFFSFVTMFEIFESSDIRNSFCLIIVISIIFNWNTSVENNNDKEGSRCGLTP